MDVKTLLEQWNFSGVRVASFAQKLARFVSHRHANKAFCGLATPLLLIGLVIIGVQTTESAEGYFPSAFDVGQR